MAFLMTKGIILNKESPKDDEITEPSVECFHLDHDRDEELGFALSQYNLNYKFDKPDSRDYKFSSIVFKDIDPNALPWKVDLRTHWGEILDQGSLGSCVANSVAYQLRFLLKKVTGNVVNMSRLYIYYNGRALAGYPINEDTGLTMRGGFQSVAAQGAIQENFWPYVISQYAIRAPDSVYIEARKNKGILYYSVAQDLLQIKKCLKDGFAISFGIALFESFMTLTVARGGQVPIPDESKENRVGGHAMTIIGYNDTLQKFIVANQWGKSWGDLGYCYIPYSLILNKRLTGDLWTLRSYNLGGDAPLPTPVVPTPVPTVSKWAPNIQYYKNDLVSFLGSVYQCMVSHRSISVWTPMAVPAIWKKL